MHGQLKLPGTKRRCAVPGLEPEGENCPVCAGDMEVTATTTFTRSALSAQPTKDQTEGEALSLSSGEGGGEDSNARPNTRARLGSTSMCQPSSGETSKGGGG